MLPCSRSTRNGSLVRRMVNKLDLINAHYGTDFREGDRIVYSGSEHERAGVVTGAANCYLRIRIDGDQSSSAYHPTWKIKNLTATERAE